MAKSATPKTPLISNSVLLLFVIGWGIFALLFFLLFSVPPPGQEQPFWYAIGITVLETGAFLIASGLCFRNWRSGQIVSGRTVWLWIGLGLLVYGLGNILFFLWGNIWNQDPSVSLGDIFYLLSYVFLAGGMLQAVLPRRLNLEWRQWVVVGLVGVLGVYLAYFLNYQVGDADLSDLFPSLGGGEVPAEVVPAPEGEVAPPEGVTPGEVIPEAPPEAPPEGGETTLEEGSAEEVAAAESAPSWVYAVNDQLEPFQGLVSLLYVVGDCLLIVVATTLLVAFWGGRFSQSWKLIAIAAFCLYIADMFFAYYVKQATYQEGSLWEVFWTFSALFFGMGAVVEHTISTRVRRSPRRRRAGG